MLIICPKLLSQFHFLFTFDISFDAHFTCTVRFGQCADMFAVYMHKTYSDNVFNSYEYMYTRTSDQV